MEPQVSHTGISASTSARYSGFTGTCRVVSDLPTGPQTSSNGPRLPRWRRLFSNRAGASPPLNPMDSTLLASSLYSLCPNPTTSGSSSASSASFLLWVALAAGVTGGGIGVLLGWHLAPWWSRQVPLRYSRRELKHRNSVWLLPSPTIPPSPSMTRVERWWGRPQTIQSVLRDSTRKKRERSFGYATEWVTALFGHRWVPRRISKPSLLRLYGRRSLPSSRGDGQRQVCHGGRGADLEERWGSRMLNKDGTSHLPWDATKSLTSRLFSPFCLPFSSVRSLSWQRQPQCAVSVFCYASNVSGAGPPLSECRSEEAAPLLCLPRQGFTLLYDPVARLSVWCGYFMTREGIDRARQHRRCVTFFTDRSLSKEERRVLTEVKWRGYDRGHLAPHASVASSAQAAVESALLTNVQLQHRDVNRGVWRWLEAATRSYVRQPMSAHDGKAMVRRPRRRSSDLDGLAETMALPLSGAPSSTAPYSQLRKGSSDKRCRRVQRQSVRRERGTAVGCRSSPQDGVASLSDAGTVTPLPTVRDATAAQKTSKRRLRYDGAILAQLLAAAPPPPPPRSLPSSFCSSRCTQEAAVADKITKACLGKIRIRPQLTDLKPGRMRRILSCLWPRWARRVVSRLRGAHHRREIAINVGPLYYRGTFSSNAQASSNNVTTTQTAIDCRETTASLTHSTALPVCPSSRDLPKATRIRPGHKRSRYGWRLSRRNIFGNQRLGPSLGRTRSPQMLLIPDAFFFSIWDVHTHQHTHLVVPNDPHTPTMHHVAKALAARRRVVRHHVAPGVRPNQRGSVGRRATVDGASLDLAAALMALRVPTPELERLFAESLVELRCRSIAAARTQSFQARRGLIASDGVAKATAMSLPEHHPPVAIRTGFQLFPVLRLRRLWHSGFQQ